ncbi:MAG: hypothetical protein KIT36_11770 [Alphaproteobacteria bacterium]|nr:hypothetical protein [Alphaproteobacteria bacterium]
MLEVVSAAGPIAAAMRRLRRRLAGMPVRGVSISWHGGGAVRGDIVWLRDERFWWRHDAARYPGRHNLMFGVAPHAPAHSESAACEINLAAAGADRRLAGALVRDDTGALYLAHSGKIGGGRSGRRRQALRAFLAGGNWQTVRWPDGRVGELLLIAPLEGPRLARQIGRFVHAVNRYKRQDAADPPRRGFGEAPVAYVDGAPGLAALCDRGLVMDALEAELTRRGALGDGESGEPLFAASKRTTRVIELETDPSRPALERAVGRLVLRAASSGAASRALLVVPDAAANPALAALARHGVTLVRYRWQGARPVFVGLDAALG